jgi:hypothetical protein
MERRFWMLRKSVLLGAVFSALALATSAQADFTFTDGTIVRDTPVGSEVTIVEIYNTVYGTHLDWDGLNLRLEPNQVWNETRGTVIAQARFAGYEQEFGYYTDLGHGSARSEIIDITNADGTGYLDVDPVTYAATGFSQIGFYRYGPDGKRWFSEIGLNGDCHSDHLIAFWAPADHSSSLLFWEDLPSPGWDHDYNDLAVQLFGASGGNEIPEPSSILLVLTGLGGLAYWRRRK